MAKGPTILSGTAVIVYEAPTLRRKIGALGSDSTEEDVSLHSLELGTPLPVPSGGTGLSSVQLGDLLVGTGPNLLARLPSGPDGYGLLAKGAGQLPEYSFLGLEQMRNQIAALETGMVVASGEYVRTEGGEPIWVSP